MRKVNNEEARVHRRETGKPQDLPLGFLVSSEGFKCIKQMALKSLLT